ncbi:hypothetical protein HU200_019337 [Digitaria exilis]|uniref:Uncharacterized protein n=1 Tax=Digitaria exilis TaxID=1010633 RepID=A0A835F365_9POAL|nr:hypothetical protein HU200_019337 [Digitaria exilis]
MKSKVNGSIQKAGKANDAQGGPNWVFVAGVVLISTLSVGLGSKLKQLFVTKQEDTTTKGLGFTRLNCNVYSYNFLHLEMLAAHNWLHEIAAKRRPGACELHSDLYRFRPGHADGGADVKQAPPSPISKSTEPTNLLVKIPALESSKENSGVMWSSSPDRLEDPYQPFQYSNCSGSPSVSESGSDIYSKREVIQKLRQQLKRRDEMIMEMQAQIADLKNSLTIQVTQNTNLQSQLDGTNRDLFESEREVQHLRKIIADHCVAESLSHDKPFQAGQWQSNGTNGHDKPCQAGQWPSNGTNGHVNGYSDSSVDDPELHCSGIEKRNGEAERVELLKREVSELKEVIEGKDFLLQSYKEQKGELCSKIRELEEKLSAQVPNIL